MFAKATPFTCTGHTYDTVITSTQTFTAANCAYCSEHKVITAIRKFFKL